MDENKEVEVETTLKASIKEALDYIPYISIAIVVLSLAKQIMFYESFNIQIINYISLSELALIIAPDLLIATPLIIAYLLLLRKYIEVALSLAGTKKTSSVNETTDETLTDEKAKSVKGKRIIFLIAVPLLSIFLAIMPPRILAHYSYLDYLNFGVKLFLIGLTFLRYKRFTGKWMYLSSIGLYLLLFYLFAKEVDNIKFVLDGKYKGTKIYTSDTSFKESTDSIFYIGQTEKYLFIFNKKDTTTDIIPTSSITKISLKIRDKK